MTVSCWLLIFFRGLLLNICIERGKLLDIVRDCLAKINDVVSVGPRDPQIEHHFDKSCMTSGVNLPVYLWGA